MNKTEERPRGNIHTVGYRSTKQPLTYLIKDNKVWCEKDPTLCNELWRFKLNAERAIECINSLELCKNQLQPFTLRDEDKALKEVLHLCSCANAETTRVDFKFDWHETEYRELKRLNRLLLACFEVSSRAKDTWDTKSVIKKETKSLKVRTHSFEIEFYDKKEQAPETSWEYGTKGRLEFRYTKLMGESISHGVFRLETLLNELKGYAGQAEEKQNQILFKYWLEECYTLNRWTTFFKVHEEYFYTLRQTQAFLLQIGRKNPKKDAYNQQDELKKINSPPLLHHMEYEKYADMLLGEFKRFQRNSSVFYDNELQKKVMNFKW